MRKFIDAIKENVLVFDGSKGYMLQREGLSGGESAEVWNITKNQTVRELYQKYKDAGSDVIQTNTFQGTAYHLQKYGYGDKVREINYTAAKTAREVMGHDGYVAASVGPLGRMMTPSGDLSFDEAYNLYKEQIIPLIDGGVDAVNFETFTDVAELRAAILAVKDVKNDMPIIASVAFEENKRTLMGTSPYIAALILKTLGCAVIGTNCSFGPHHMKDIVKEMSLIGGPISVKPNAGIPRMEEGQVVYDQQASDFSINCESFLPYGAALIGGCCGTTPEFVSELKKSLSDTKPQMKNTCETGEIASLTAIVNAIEYNKLTETMLDLNNPKTCQMFKKGDLMDLMTLAMDAGDEDSDVIVLRGGCGLETEQMLRSFDIIQGFVKKPFVFEIGQEDLLAGLLRIYRGRGGVIAKGMKAVEEVAERYGSLIVDKR